MTKYGLVYKTNDGQIVYTGSFIGKNHHRIKFVMYRYLKKILEPSKSIKFAIQEVRTNKKYVYIGTSTKSDNTDIGVNTVKKASKHQESNFWKEIKSIQTHIPYTKTHSYREEYDSDELSLSETDLELDEN